MNSSALTLPGDRLVDYFVVVGLADGDGDGEGDEVDAAGQDADSDARHDAGEVDAREGAHAVPAADAGADADAPAQHGNHEHGHHLDDAAAAAAAREKEDGAAPAAEMAGASAADAASAASATTTTATAAEAVAETGKQMQSGTARPQHRKRQQQTREVRSPGPLYDVASANLSTPSGKAHPFKTAFTPTLLDRYPLSDHADAALPPGVASFCFPMGIRLRRPRPPDEPLPTFFVFMATGACRRVCTRSPAPARNGGECLRRFHCRLLGHSLPLAHGSHTPFVIWVKLHASSHSATPTSRACVRAGGKGEHVFGHVLTFYEKTTPRQQEYFDTDIGAAASGGAPFFTPKCFCILSRWNFPGFRTFLTELYRVSISPNALPLERIICNFCAEVPLPPAGVVEVQYRCARACFPARQCRFDATF